MPPSRPSPRDSWFAPLSIDLLVRVLHVTLLHPFVCWMLPLCLRAQTVRWDAPRMIGSVAWACLVTLGWMAGLVNRRVAYGLPREVDLSEEVIVVTGGASGLGMLIAEVYGMRGASVAVLDVNDLEDGEARGVTVYRCDVGDGKRVAEVAVEIERDVSFFFSVSLSFLFFSCFFFPFCLFDFSCSMSLDPGACVSYSAEMSKI